MRSPLVTPASGKHPHTFSTCENCDRAEAWPLRQSAARRAACSATGSSASSSSDFTAAALLARSHAAHLRCPPLVQDRNPLEPAGWRSRSFGGGFHRHEIGHAPSARPRPAREVAAGERAVLLLQPVQCGAGRAIRRRYTPCQPCPCRPASCRRRHSNRPAVRAPSPTVSAGSKRHSTRSPSSLGSKTHCGSSNGSPTRVQSIGSTSGSAAAVERRRAVAVGIALARATPVPPAEPAERSVIQMTPALPVVVETLMMPTHGHWQRQDDPVFAPVRTARMMQQDQTMSPSRSTR